jgi:hypothetical protein
MVFPTVWPCRTFGNAEKTAKGGSVLVLKICRLPLAHALQNTRLSRDAQMWNPWICVVDRYGFECGQGEVFDRRPKMG